MVKTEPSPAPDATSPPESRVAAEAAAVSCEWSADASPCGGASLAVSDCGHRSDEEGLTPKTSRLSDMDEPPPFLPLHSSDAGAAPEGAPKPPQSPTLSDLARLFVSQHPADSDDIGNNDIGETRPGDHSPATPAQRSVALGSLSCRRETGGKRRRDDGEATHRTAGPMQTLAAPRQPYEELVEESSAAAGARLPPVC